MLLLGCHKPRRSNRATFGQYICAETATKVLLRSSYLGKRLHENTRRVKYSGQVVKKKRKLSPYSIITL
jgi:hypothetical protein